MRPYCNHYTWAYCCNWNSSADYSRRKFRNANHTAHEKKNCLLPGRDIGSAHFLKQAEDYGIWLCHDAAAAVMELLKEVQRSGDSVEDLRVERPSLEERFLELIEGGKQQ